jgi:hypothetical protein
MVKVKTLEERIAVMQAAADGKAIECRGCTGKVYCETHYPAWNWSEYDYRVKGDFSDVDMGRLFGRRVHGKNVPVSKIVTEVSQNRKTVVVGVNAVNVTIESLDEHYTMDGGVSIKDFLLAKEE